MPGRAGRKSPIMLKDENTQGESLIAMYQMEVSEYRVRIRPVIARCIKFKQLFGIVKRFIGEPGLPGAYYKIVRRSLFLAENLHIFLSRMQIRRLTQAVTEAPAWLRWTAFGAVLWGIGFLFCRSMGVDGFDEAWFLQVVRRVLAGEILYRDVCYETTPLPVAVASAAAMVMGIEILVTKALLALCFAGSVLLVALGGRLVRSGTLKLPLLLPWFCLVYSPAFPNSLYTPMAAMLLLACLTLTLVRVRTAPAGSKKELWLEAAAGAAAGLCAASKQNMGALALAALVGVAMADVAAGTRRLRRAAAATGAILAGFTAAVLAVIAVPVAVSGASGAFWYQGFSSKLDYLRAASVPYSNLIRQAFVSLMHPSPARFAGFLLQSGFLLPLAVLPGLAAGWLFTKGSERRLPAALLFFSLAAVAGQYPRYDFSHAVYILPVCAVGFTWMADRMLSRVSHAARRRMKAACVLWLGAGTAAMAHLVIRSSAESCRSGLPHFRNALFSCDTEARVRERARILGRLAPGGTAWVVSAESGFYSLAANLRNPTPFDYTIAPVIGRRGGKTVSDLLARGGIPVVAVMPPPRNSQWALCWPSSLVDSVAAHLSKVAELDWVTVYAVSGTGRKAADMTP
jgi:hypothetical protein